MDYKYLGELIEQKRIYKAISVEDLAKETKVSIENVNRIRGGKRINKEDLNRLIDYLGVVLF